MTIVMNDGLQFSGTAAQIVRGMRTSSWAPQDSLMEYARWVADQARVLTGADIWLPGPPASDDEETLCHALVDGLLAYGLAKKL